MASPQQVIKRTNDKTDLSFPLHFNEFYQGVPFFVLNFMRNTPDYSLGKTPEREQVDRSITLPMPQSIQDSTGIEYNTESLGIFAHTAISALSGGSKSVGTDISVATIAKQLLDAETEKFSAEKSVGSAAKVAAQIAAARAGGITSKAFSVLKGEQLNPHLAVFFQQINLKTYSCTWSFSPESEEESKAIANIIRAIQYHSHPAYTSGKQAGHLLRWPDIVLPSIENSDAFLGARSPYIFKPASVTQIDIDYTPSGGAFHAHKEGAAPVMTTVQMAFSEIQIVTREDYE